LVRILDESLKITDGDEHDFYNQFNGLEKIKHVILVHDSNILVGCGAIKHHDKNSVEIKRMFVIDKYRGKGIASKILKSLEKWAQELSYTQCILETGSRQKSAIALYQKNDYKVIENYAQYIGIKNSICFKKIL